MPSSAHAPARAAAGAAPSTGRGRTGAGDGAGVRLRGGAHGVRRRAGERGHQGGAGRDEGFLLIGISSLRSSSLGAASEIAKTWTIWSLPIRGCAARCRRLKQ